MASWPADHVMGQLAVEATLVELVELDALEEVEKFGLALVEAVGDSRGCGVGLRHDRHVVDAAAEVVWDHETSLHAAFSGQKQPLKKNSQISQNSHIAKIAI